MRKNIFEVYEENNTLEKDFCRIQKYYSEHAVIEKFGKMNCMGYIYEGSNDITLEEVVEQYLFRWWKARHFCLNCSDFLQMIGFESITEKAMVDEEAFLSYIEVIYNFWYLTFLHIKEEEPEIKFKLYVDFNELRDYLDDCLSRHKHKAVLNREMETVIVVGENPAAELVAGKTEQRLAQKIYMYNHDSLKGDIDGKRMILFAMGQELEPKRKALLTINKEFTNIIFDMLNQLNIRHNNCDPQDKGKYKQFVAAMDESELEHWYDELYRMILLANLSLEQNKRKFEIRSLLNEINAKEN